MAGGRSRGCPRQPDLDDRTRGSEASVRGLSQGGLCVWPAFCLASRQATGRAAASLCRPVHWGGADGPTANESVGTIRHSRRAYMHA